MKKLLLLAVIFTSSFLTAQRTGDMPYIHHFGINQVQEGSGAHYKIRNGDENDIVIALTNHETGEVVAHAFIESGHKYTFFNLPIGSYTYKFSNAGDYFKDEEPVELKGCDSTKYLCDLENHQYERSLKVWVTTSRGSKGKSRKITKDEFFSN